MKLQLHFSDLEAPFWSLDNLCMQWLQSWSPLPHGSRNIWNINHEVQAWATCMCVQGLWPRPGSYIRVILFPESLYMVPLAVSVYASEHEDLKGVSYHHCHSQAQGPTMTGWARNDDFLGCPSSTTAHPWCSKDKNLQCRHCLHPFIVYNLCSG